MSRKENSVRNINFSLLNQFLYVFLSFIVRTFFIRILGSEYLGINGLFSNILMILSLADLGIGSAIIYSLYKPIADSDEELISQLMDFFRRVYIIIGVVILAIGLSFTPFLDLIIRSDTEIQNLVIIYVLFVISSSSSYFFAYKRSFLLANQKQYLNIIFHIPFYLAQVFLQLFILIMFKDYILYLISNILIQLLENIYVYYKVNQLYPFLKTKVKSRINSETLQKIVKNTKALIFHKIGTVLVMGTDNILISSFVGIIQVGMYSNYLLITQSLTNFISPIFSSLLASVGNLRVTENDSKNIEMFWIIDFVNFWIYSFSAICLLILFNPFIDLWIGSKFILDQNIVTLIVVSFFLTGRRSSTLLFKDAMGLFWEDRYKPIFESMINLVFSIALASYGIAGILAGTIISTLTTVFWIEPFVVFKRGFNVSSNLYFIKYLKYLVVLLVAYLVTFSISNLLIGSGFIVFVLKMVIVAIVPNLIYILIFRKKIEFIYIKSLILSYFQRILNHLTKSK